MKLLCRGRINGELGCIKEYEIYELESLDVKEADVVIKQGDDSTVSGITDKIITHLVEIENSGKDVDEFSILLNKDRFLIVLDIDNIKEFNKEYDRNIVKYIVLMSFKHMFTGSECTDIINSMFKDAIEGV